MSGWDVIAILVAAAVVLWCLTARADGNDYDDW
jgi:hypothetical protein